MVFFDYSVGNGKPQSGATFLGRFKGFKQALKDIVSDYFAGVTDSDHSDMVAGLFPVMT